MIGAVLTNLFVLGEHAMLPAVLSLVPGTIAWGRRSGLRTLPGTS